MTARAELIERLRALSATFTRIARDGLGSLRRHFVTRDDYAGEALALSQAADVIEQQEREIERLRAALAKARALYDAWVATEEEDGTTTLHAVMQPIYQALAPTPRQGG